jgi:hypothetical protein
LIELESLLPPGSGWSFLSPTDINNAMQVVGRGVFHGEVNWFRMTIVSALPTGEPRGFGFWRHQCSGAGFQEVRAEEVEALFGEVSIASSVFPECASIGCESFLFDPPNNEMRPQTERHLLTLWLNVASDRLRLTTPIDLPGLTDALTVGEAIIEIESTVCDSTASRSELERSKDIAEAINAGEEDMELVGEVTSLTIAPGEEHSVTLGLINMSSSPQTYDLEAIGRWSVRVSVDQVTGLAPGAIALIWVAVTAPGYVSAGDSVQIRVVASDRNSRSGVAREVVLHATVLGTGSGGSKRMLPPD